MLAQCLVTAPRHLRQQARHVLSRTFAALADPTRRALLTHLREGELTVSDLSAPFDQTLAAVSKHLLVLERAGLVEQRREGARRPRRLVVAPLAAAEAWIARYRKFWTGSLDRLDTHLRSNGKDIDGQG
ncbi:MULTISPECIES: metalloregulator ArsR/SmtB family transcription factor [Sphingomonadales]|uniref:ArsR/SmtB family transcription factor n=1 Tax=Sphingomonadales TaxID=204457 RepID=UPI001E4D0B77|nr:MULTISPECIES: metalloregulator ArsR/SmtB family transcription factor [Sphingomonadales]